MSKALLLFLALCPWQYSYAEYRVFLLKISVAQEPSPLGTPLPEEYRLVRSTLDPIQYPKYYPIKKNEVVTYIDTWMCKGNTSGIKPLCPNPKPLSDANASIAESRPKNFSPVSKLAAK